MQIRQTQHVLYAEPLPADLRQVVETAMHAELPTGFTLTILQSAERAELLSAVSRADYMVAATNKIDASVLDAGASLKLVQQQGVGYDNVDVEACRTRGVRLALTPEGTTTGVAEHTFLLLLALFKNLREAEHKLRSGGWPVWELRSRSFELSGKTLGLVGLGRIGRAVAARARAFEARVIYYDPFRASESDECSLGAEYRPFEQLLGEADVVSLHLPATAETRHIMDAHAIGLMQRHAVLLNTARGQLVDEAALVRALREGVIAGAGLDVFEQEPPAASNPLLQLENVVVTPHISAGTLDAFRTKMSAVFANIGRVSRGEEPANAVI
jgi:phosphoglycerate dehydrogenase-like enzyme